MGDLILMTRSTRPSRGALSASESAAILFFTGVRYSRMPDEMSVPPTSAKRRAADKTKAKPEACLA